MGRSQTYNYEIQVEIAPYKYRTSGAMRYAEAIEKLLNDAQDINAIRGYIWPQTDRARRKINNMRLRTLGRVDFLEVNITKNDAVSRKYVIRGRVIGDIE